MVFSSLPPFKLVLLRFKAPFPRSKQPFRQNHKTRIRLFILPFIVTLLVLFNSTRQQKPIPTTSHRDPPTTVTLHLADAALHDFRNTRKLAERTTRFFDDDETNIRVLVDMCRVPPVFVSRLRPEGRRLLLGRLTKDSNAVPLWTAMPKIIVVDLQNGLGNRLRALASAMEFAFVTSRVLIVLWVPDAHINARITDLFDRQVLDNLIFIEQPVPWPIDQNHIPQSAKGADRVSLISRTHPAAASFRYYDFMTKDDGFRSQRNRQVRNSWSTHLYVKTAYMLESRHMNHRLRNVFLQALTPSAPVMSLVRDVEERLGGAHVLRGMVGVHLRSRTIVHDNDAVDYECEYSVDGAQTTDKWRKMSTPKQFIPEMKRVQREWPSIVKRSFGLEPIPTWSVENSIALANRNHDPADITQVGVTKPPKFFVCVDSIHTLKELSAVFPKDSLVTLQRDCDDRGPECIIYAFADIVLLSRTGAMLASGWSSFSEVALMMRIRPRGVHPSSNEGYYVKKSGFDFGMPSRWDRLMLRIETVFKRTPQSEYFANHLTQQAQRELCKQRRLNAVRR